MCELVYSNTFDRDRNIAIAYGLGFVDGFTNPDGTGFYSPGGSVWKSKFGAANLLNLLPELCREVKNSAPIILHTRFATIGVGGGIDKVVTDNNAHPFNSGNYVVAHNGTLTPKTPPKDVVKGMTDSEYFAIALNSKREQGKTFVEIFNSTMEEFTGKFAFLIYDIEDSKMYAVRGSSANLHYMPVQVGGELIGHVINTKREDLVRGVVLAQNISETRRKGFSFKTTEILEFPVNTIWDITGKEPKEVGKTKENFPVSTPRVSTGGVGIPIGGTKTIIMTTDPVPGLGLLRSAAKYGITLSQLNWILIKALDKSFLELTEDDLKALDSCFNTEVSIRATRGMQDDWDEIVAILNDDSGHLAYKHNIAFPFFTEQSKTLSTLAKALKKEEVTNASVHEIVKKVFKIHS